MTDRLPILAAIDAALETADPAAVRATAEGHILHEAQTFLIQAGLRSATYRGVVITRSLAQLENGFVVQISAPLDI